MMIKKHYFVTISNKCPNGTIISISFGTEKSVDNVLDAAPRDAQDKFEKKLFMEVFKATKADIKRAIRQDSMVKEIWLGMKDSIRQSRKERAAEKSLEEDDDD